MASFFYTPEKKAVRSEPPLHTSHSQLVPDYVVIDGSASDTAPKHRCEHVPETPT